MEGITVLRFIDLYAWLNKGTDEFTVVYLSCTKLIEFGDLVKQPIRHPA